MSFLSNVLCAEIDFEEFLAIYKRIFVLSKSTVGDNVNDITLQPPKLVPAELHQASQQLSGRCVSAYIYINDMTLW